MSYKVSELRNTLEKKVVYTQPSIVARGSIHDTAAALHKPRHPKHEPPHTGRVTGLGLGFRVRVRV